jgi:hypothetical protein
MTDEINQPEPAQEVVSEPVAVEHPAVTGSPHSILSEIESKLAQVGHLPVEFAAFLRAKLAELRSQL